MFEQFYVLSWIIIKIVLLLLRIFRMVTGSAHLAVVGYVGKANFKIKKTRNIQGMEISSAPNVSVNVSLSSI